MGFSSANNQALKTSSGRYRLLLNPDTEITDNAFKNMVEFMDARGDIDALGCRLLLGDGSLQRNCRHFPSLFTDFMEIFYLDSIFPKSRFFNYYRMGDWAHNDTREVDHVYGACLLIRQEALKRVGFLDEDLFMYYDEIDLCFRIKKSGGKVLFTDKISIIHHANKSSGQDADLCEHYKQASRIHFFAKHYGKFSVALLGLNLLVKKFLILPVLGISHIAFRRPRDIEALKKPLDIMWSELIKYIGKDG